MREALTDRREPSSGAASISRTSISASPSCPISAAGSTAASTSAPSREMFYANPSIKKALIGYRGAWAAFGVEFNFPVSHNWVSMSPVDFATTGHPDGSGSIWVGNTDQVYGARWRVELRLRPGRAVLDQQVALANVGDVRHRYYWWSNAAVQVWDDSRLVYPTELMGTHGFTRIEPWPIDRQGPRPQRDSQSDRRSGVALHASARARASSASTIRPRTAAPCTWRRQRSCPSTRCGRGATTAMRATWRTALSDDDSAYVELQAGLFRNQETYALPRAPGVGPVHGALAAGARSRRHHARGGGRGPVPVATLADASPHRARRHPRPRRRPHRRPAGDDGRRSTAASTCRPARSGARDLDASVAPVTFEIRDSDGALVMTHTEGVVRSDARGRRQASGPRCEPREIAAPAVVERGLQDELEGRRLVAMAAYRDALARDAGNVALLKAAGRLSVALGWPEAGAREANRLARRCACAQHERHGDASIYLGLALDGAGRPVEARPHFEAAARFRATRAAALAGARTTCGSRWRRRLGPRPRPLHRRRQRRHDARRRTRSLRCCVVPAA